MRTGDAEGLVEHQHNARRRIELFAIDAHALGQIRRQRDAQSRVDERLSIQHDAAGAQQLLRLAARAIAEIGEQPVEPERRRLAHLRASKIL